MIKILQFSLLVSCVFLFCSQENNTVGTIDIWSVEQPFEENHLDLDNNDLDWATNQLSLFTAIVLTNEPLFSIIESKEQENSSHRFIRAPPKAFI